MNAYPLPPYQLPGGVIDVPPGAALTDEQLDQLRKEAKERDARNAAEYARQVQEERLRQWNEQRKSLWTSVIINASIAYAIRGDEPGKEVLLAANRAVAWFDETWGSEFPIDVKVSK